MLLRRFVFAAALLALLISAAWIWGAHQVRAGIDAWAAERRTAGWTVDWSDEAIGGFPFSLIIRLQNPILGRPDHWGWSAEAITLRVSVLDRRHIHATAPGRHGLTLGPWSGAGKADTLDGDLVIDRVGRVSTVQISGQGLTLAPIGLQALAVSFGPGTTFALSLAGLELPEMSRPVLDRRISMLELDGHVTGPWPADTFEQWRAGGGTVEIEHLGLEWPPLMIDGEGTAALDSASQPLAAFSARVRGLSPMMDRLVAAGVVDKAAATAAKVLVAVLSKPDAQGRGTVNAPFTLQDGALWMGPARLFAVPPLPTQWVQPPR